MTEVPPCFNCGKPSVGPARHVVGRRKVFACSTECCLVEERKAVEAHPYLSVYDEIAADLERKREASSPALVTVPADLAEWAHEAQGKCRGWTVSTDSGRTFITTMETMSGSISAQLQIVDGNARTVATVGVCVSREPEEVASMALRAAVALGLVRTTGGKP